jgi:hypothetical protein
MKKTASSARQRGVYSEQRELVTPTESVWHQGAVDGLAFVYTDIQDDTPGAWCRRNPE